MPRKRKEFHVYRRDNDVYYVRLPRDGGGYMHLSLGVTNERDAYRVAEGEVAKIKSGGGAFYTFHDAALKFARDHFPTLSDKSAQRYDTSYKAVKPVLGALALNEIGTSQISEFVTARRKAGVTERTIRRDLMFVSSVYTQCTVWEWTERNPVAAYMAKQKAKSGLKQRVSRKRYLSAEERRRLEEAAEVYLAQPAKPSQRHERLMTVAAVFVSINQGVRRGELTALLRTDIDRARGAHGELCVRAEDDGASKSEPRRLPLFPRARRWLDQLPAHPEAPWVFWHGLGRRYGKFQTGFRTLLELAGIEGVTWHDLRRTCGCVLLQELRWDMKRVSEFLGHSNTEITEEHYAFLRTEDLHAEMHRSSGRVS